VYYTDPGFLKIFDYNLIIGNPETVLSSPFSIVLSERSAEKFFGNENPIGKVIKCDNGFDLTVKGIIENVPSNSHLNFDCLISFSTLGSVNKEGYLDNWNSLSYTIYVLLEEKNNRKNLEKMLAVLQ